MNKKTLPAQNGRHLRFISHAIIYLVFFSFLAIFFVLSLSFSCQLPYTDVIDNFFRSEAEHFTLVSFIFLYPESLLPSSISHSLFLSPFFAGQCKCVYFLCVKYIWRIIIFKLAKGEKV